MKSFVVHWCGPYHIPNIDYSFGKKGIYLYCGKAKYQRELNIVYCGITEQHFRDRFRQHPQIPNIKDLKVWIGQIDYPERSNRSHLELIEAAIIYYYHPKLNIQKKVSYPEPITLVSHWFKADETPRLIQPTITSALPDVICWDGEYWRTANLKVEKEN
jgi:hypothetical protein